MGLPVHSNAARAIADIDHAERAALEEWMAGGGGRLGLVGQGDRRRRGRRAADHEALVMQVVRLISPGGKGR
jgi:hypothetical protein